MERKLDQFAFEAAVVADAGGWASSAEGEALDGDHLAWAAALRRLIHETDDGLRSASSLTGELRELVLSDLAGERERLAAVLFRLTGDGIDPPVLTTGTAATATATSAANGTGASAVAAPGSPAGAWTAFGSWD